MSSYLIHSSLGKKFVMSITGCALVLFLLFHMSMNVVAIFSAEAYDMICEFLGANWYALVATVGLMVLIAVHMIYAVILTLNNYRARGTQRYAMTVKEKGVSWASKNMLALGVIILLGLGMHLVHFWSKMQLVEIMGQHENSLGLSPTEGAALIAHTFSKWYNVVLYLVWFFAMWFHLTHGVWSMFQSSGLSNAKWLPRLKRVSQVVSTLMFLGFAAVVVVFYLRTNFSWFQF